MIPLRDQEVLRQRFKADLPSRIRIDFFTQKPSPIFIPGRRECLYCKEIQTLLEEIASLSERISLTVHEFEEASELAKTLSVDKVPATVVRGQTNRPIRYFGIPSGTGFIGFIETLIDSSTGKVELAPETVRQLRKLKTDVHLQVLTMTSCQFSPVVSRLAAMLALQSNRIKVDMIEIGEFPELIQRYGVRATPVTVIDDKLAIPGAMDEATLLQVIFKVVEGKPLSGSLRTGPSSALPAPEPQQQQGPVRAPGGSGLILPR